MRIVTFLLERSDGGVIDPAAVEETRAAHYRDLLPDGVHTAGHRFAALFVDGERVGRVWFGPLRGRMVDHYLYGVDIDPEHRGRGFGRKAMNQMIDEVEQAGATRIGLTVAEANIAAIHLYESLGFVTSRSDATQREMWLQLHSPRAPDHSRSA